MKDCKDHYTDMLNVRMGEAECPFCINQRLRNSIETAIDKLDSVAPELIEAAANQQTRKLAKALEGE